MYSSRILKLKYNVRKQWNYLVLWVYLHPKTSNKIRTLQIVTWVCPKIIPGLKCPSISVPVNSTLSKKGQHCRLFLKILELCPVAYKFCFCFFFLFHMLIDLGVWLFRFSFFIFFVLSVGWYNILCLYPWWCVT